MKKKPFRELSLWSVLAVCPGALCLSRWPLIVECVEILDPANLCTVYVSPRIRAHKTFHLLFDHVEKLPDHIITEEVREWDYGEYEGLKPAEIQGIRPGWSIWRDGCPGGESAEEMCFRVDLVIEKVSSRPRIAAFSFLIDVLRSGSIIENTLKKVPPPVTSSLSPTDTSIVYSSLGGTDSPLPLVRLCRPRSTKRG